MIKYVAFLRGINVGGHKKINMEELRKAFESLGFQQVKTILATGNVLFGTPETDRQVLSRAIREQIEKAFGLEVSVIIRTLKEIQALTDANPFNGITLTPQTRLYVTFLAEKPQSSLAIPYESADKNFKIIRVSESEVCSILQLTPTGGSPEAMNILEKEFGKKITTRNWNTVIKILNR